jgi:glycosyltransferase involved in cell wall biosynthesis
MDVSLVLPERNRRSLLAMTLRRVLRQRDVDLEVIVVDQTAGCRSAVQTLVWS